MKQSAANYYSVSVRREEFLSWKTTGSSIIDETNEATVEKETKKEEGISQNLFVVRFE